MHKRGVRGDRLFLNFRRTTETFIIKLVQQETFDLEITALRSGKAVPKNSSIVNLDPYLDDDSILRVGGRLRSAEIDRNFKNPCIIP